MEGVLKYVIFVKNNCKTMQSEIYTAERAAQLLECNTKTVQRLCRRGELTAHKRLRKWFILHSDLVRFIQGGEASQQAA